MECIHSCNSKRKYSMSSGANPLVGSGMAQCGSRLSQGLLVTRLMVPINLRKTETGDASRDGNRGRLPSREANAVRV